MNKSQAIRKWDELRSEWVAKQTLFKLSYDKSYRVVLMTEMRDLEDNMFNIMININNYPD